MSTSTIEWGTGLESPLGIVQGIYQGTSKTKVNNQMRSKHRTRQWVQGACPHDSNMSPLADPRMISANMGPIMRYFCNKGHECLPWMGYEMTKDIAIHSLERLLSTCLYLRHIQAIDPERYSINSVTATKSKYKLQSRVKDRQ